MDSNGLWFKRSSGNLPLPPSGCGTMEASAMIPTTKSNRPGIHANANRRPTYERSSRQASMRWGARWARGARVFGPTAPVSPTRYGGPRTRRGEPDPHRSLLAENRSTSGCQRGSREIARRTLGNGRESRRESAIEGVADRLADRVAGALCKSYLNQHCCSVARPPGLGSARSRSLPAASDPYRQVEHLGHGQPKFRQSPQQADVGAGGYPERAPYDPSTQRAFRDRRRIERRGGCRFQVSI